MSLGVILQDKVLDRVLLNGPVWLSIHMVDLKITKKVITRFAKEKEN